MTRFFDWEVALSASINLELGGVPVTERPTIGEFLTQIFTNAVYRAPFTELGFLVIPWEVRAIPTRGLCKCTRMARVEFFAPLPADFEPKEGTVYVPESVERIGGMRIAKLPGRHPATELERLAYCVMVRAPEKKPAEKVSETPAVTPQTTKTAR